MIDYLEFCSLLRNNNEALKQSTRAIKRQYSKCVFVVHARLCIAALLRAVLYRRAARCVPQCMPGPHARMHA